MLKLEESFTNAMTDIKDEIFETNSTLFQVLDKNEVTDIVSIRQEQERQEQLIRENKTQLDGLARIVDTNQANNAAEFVRINTQFVDIEQKFASLDLLVQDFNEDIAGLTREVRYLDSYTRDLDNRVGMFEFDVDNVNNKIEELKRRADDGEEALEALRDNVRVDLGVLDRKIQVLENSNQALDDRIRKLETFSNGILRYTLPYNFRMKTDNETSPRSWTISFKAGGLKFGDLVVGSTTQGYEVQFTAKSVKNVIGDVAGLPIPLNTWVHASGFVNAGIDRYIIQESYGIYLSPI